jgi:hypothetical protein
MPAGAQLETPTSGEEFIAAHTVWFDENNYVDCHHALAIHCLMRSAVNVCRGAFAAVQIDPGEVFGRPESPCYVG